MPGWRRLGLIGSAAGVAPWAVSHSALPALSSRADGQWDVYLSTRDGEGRARIAADIAKQGGPKELADTQATAMIAYLQMLGTGLKAPADEPPVVPPPTKPAAPTPTKEGGTR